MTTRPDLDATRELLHKVTRYGAMEYRDIPRELVGDLAVETAQLLTYCRELEKEVKQLKRQLQLDLEYAHLRDHQLSSICSKREPQT